MRPKLPRNHSNIVTPFALLLLVLLSHPTTVPAATPSSPELEYLLQTHGIATQTESLAKFIEYGWRAAHRPGIMPKEPYQKAELIAHAWMLLGYRYKEVRSNNALRAYLSDLALRYATDDLPPDIMNLVQEDMQALDPATRRTARINRHLLLNFNGMVGLGIFGLPTTEVKHAVRTLYDAETQPLVRIAYAKTLGLLGDTTVLADLVGEVSQNDRQRCVSAAHAFYILTGRSFDIHENMALSQRQAVTKELITWWDKFGKARSSIDYASAMTRQFQPPPTAPYPLATLRDLLRAASDTGDTSNNRGSRTAWSKLHEMAGFTDSRKLQGKPDNEEAAEKFSEMIEPIILNPNEDLNIRTEAIAWYTRTMSEKETKKILKKIRKDPNPEIASLAEKYL